METEFVKGLVDQFGIPVRDARAMERLNNEVEAFKNLKVTVPEHVLAELQALQSRYQNVMS